MIVGFGTVILPSIPVYYHLFHHYSVPYMDDCFYCKMISSINRVEVFMGDKPYCHGYWFQRPDYLGREMLITLWSHCITSKYSIKYERSQ